MNLAATGDVSRRALEVCTPGVGVRQWRRFAKSETDSIIARFLVRERLWWCPSLRILRALMLTYDVAYKSHM